MVSHSAPLSSLHSGLLSFGDGLGSRRSVPRLAVQGELRGPPKVADFLLDLITEPVDGKAQRIHREQGGSHVLKGEVVVSEYLKSESTG